MEVGHPPRGRAAVKLGHFRRGSGDIFEEVIFGVGLFSSFPTLSRPAPFPFAGGGGWGSSTWRMQPHFSECGARRQGFLFTFKSGLIWGSPHPRCERFGGLWVLGSEAAELPLPLSWEPDLAAAIFISLLPRRVFL